MKVSFSGGETLKGVMSEIKTVDSIYFYFILFSYFELRVSVSVTLYVTVTNCHTT